VALIIPSVLALISGVTERRTRGNAMGEFSTFRMIGFASGPLRAGFLQVHLGFNATFLVATLILVQTTVGEIPPDPESAVDASQKGDSIGGLPEIRGNSLPSATILALRISTVVLDSSLSMISALENEVNHRLSQTAIGFGVAFSALTVARLVVQIPIRRLSDRIGGNASLWEVWWPSLPSRCSSDS
jgi:MFS family permease